MYGGTYPDVDHEFQVKGRIVYGNPFERDVVRRMIELQMRLMREDPESRWRNPCSVQPDGFREYEVRRKSMDGSAEAEMFLLTGNVEILEEAWLYVAAYHDMSWLSEHIADLEGAASHIESCIDEHGHLLSDVYFEDQVIKDGRNTKATAFAANGLRLLADLERQLGTPAQVQRYLEISTRLAERLVKDIDEGFWDSEKARFVDWIDRDGNVHDHLHLLANTLPVTFGFATEEQCLAISRIIDEYDSEYQRFPSFLSPVIADYTASEIGSGGPYDLCAAGRYWCWDVAYRRHYADGSTIGRQLLRVAQQAELDNYRMGERYDMDHVYYVDGKAWHGASDYYEYPCVFSWVLLYEYLGLRYAPGVDLVIAPSLDRYGSYRVEFPNIAVEVEYKEREFSVTNISADVRRLRIDLTALKLVIRQIGSEEIYPVGSVDATAKPGESLRLFTAAPV
jgi:hypothetical protein